MSPAERIQLHINGHAHEASATQRSLLDVLRHDLNLKATRMGCGLGQCGSCTVLVNGRAAQSCQTPMWSLAQAQVTTLEGLGTADQAHPLQAAFIDHQAVQCGFCTSGMVMRAHALLLTKPQPTENEVKEALHDNLCRCGVQPRVVKAVLQAASVLREGVDRPAPAVQAAPISGMVPPPAVLKTYPLLRHWLQIQDGVLVATSGKVDIGQGISHALHRLLVQTLGTPDLRMRTPCTAHSPDEGVTSGSLSVQDSGAALRLAALHLRHLALQRMAVMADVPVDAVRQNSNGLFQAGSHQASYTGLAQDAWWDTIIPTTPVGAAPSSRAAMNDWPSRALALDQREDVAAKLFGTYTFIQDLQLSGMLYGYVGRPRTLSGRWVQEAAKQLLAKLQALPGVVKVVQDGELLGVLASTEDAALQAAQRIEDAQAWDDTLNVPPSEGVSAWLKAQELQTTVVHSTPTADDATEFIASDITCLEAEFERPYLQHASIGLCCALAHQQGGKLQVWSHTQGIFNLQRDLALALGMNASDVTVHHVQGAGCYGHNGADDVAFDAAWLAAHTTQPVRVMWTRADEMRHSPLAPAMAVKVQAGVDPQGRIVQWMKEVWSQGHGTRPGRGSTPSLLGAWQTAQPAPVPLAVNAAMAVGGGSERNAVPPYDIAQQQIVNHRVLAMPLRVSAMRALGAPTNVLAAESMMDMVAQHLGQDVFTLRLAHLRDERARAVIQRLQMLTAQARSQAQPEGSGWGMAYARYKNTGAYCAVWAQVRVDHEVHLEQLVVVADVGQVISPTGVQLQLEGGALQAASWTLREQARFDAQGVQSIDWQSYKIDSFKDLPAMTIEVIDSQQAPLGAGECASGPTTAALANAVSQALGVRVRSLPLSGQRLMQLLQTD